MECMECGPRTNGATHKASGEESMNRQRLGTFLQRYALNLPTQSTGTPFTVTVVYCYTNSPNQESMETKSNLKFDDIPKHVKNAGIH
jgi:hypothetical protein